MPSARAVGVAGAGVELVLESRPDLARPLLQLLDELESEEPSEAVARLERMEPSRFEALFVAVAGAYYMTPAVRELIGYAGQEARTVDIMVDLSLYVEEGLLDPVVERGPIYRQAGT